LEQRSDIFSFGLILYEMLAGQRAFDRQSLPETMAAIANEEPAELSELNPKVTPPLDKIVRHCLEKKPEMRFQTARDLGFALETLSGSARADLGTHAPPRAGVASDETGQPVFPPASGHLLPSQHARARAYPFGWIAACVLGLSLLAMIVAYFNRVVPNAHAVRLAFAPPENLTFDNWRNDAVVVSPDGKKLVFTGRSADGRRQLYVRPLDSMEATLLPETDDARNPFWSPDSRSIAFAVKNTLKRIDVAGGGPQMLCKTESIWGGTWSQAGVILFGTASVGILQVPATGGEPVPATIREPGTGNHQEPWFLPDGRHFLFRVGRGGKELKTFVGSLNSKEVKLLLPDGGPAVYAPPGWLLFVRNGALLAQAFDAGALELRGEAFPLTKPTDIADVSERPFSVSENGVLIWQGDRLLDQQLVWFDRAGKQVGTVGPPDKVSIGGNKVRISTGGGQHPRFRRDGKELFYSGLQMRATSLGVRRLRRRFGGSSIRAFPGDRNLAKGAWSRQCLGGRGTTKATPKPSHSEAAPI
jgi:hypothetical protein